MSPEQKRIYTEFIRPATKSAVNPRDAWDSVAPVLTATMPLPGQFGMHNLWMPDPQKKPALYDTGVEPFENSSGGDIIQTADLPALLPGMFDSETGAYALSLFAHTAGLDEEKIVSVDTTYYQSGSLAYIFLSWIRDTTGRDEWAVTSLARGSFQTVAGSAIAQEARALNDISSRFAAHVKPDALKAMHPVAPYSFGVIEHASGELRRAVPMYMTPFIGRNTGQIYGVQEREGHLDRILPYWGHTSMRHGQQFLDDREAMKNASNYYGELRNDPGTAEAPWPDQHFMYDFWALVFLLSEGHLPAAHNPDAGDLLLHRYDHSLTATTMRCGWSRRLSVTEAATKLGQIKIELPLSSPAGAVCEYQPYSGRGDIRLPARGKAQLVNPTVVMPELEIDPEEYLRESLARAKKDYLRPESRFAR